MKYSSSEDRLIQGDDAIIRKMTATGGQKSNPHIPLRWA